MSARWILVLASILALAAVSMARAQDADVQAAAAAFQEGQRAQLRSDFAEAADLFEIADRAAPDPAALRSAIRNHRAAGQSARAATLAIEALDRYPDDAETSALAREVIDALGGTLGLVTVRCAAACGLTLDGRAVREHPLDDYELYVAPGDHVLVATWDGHLHQEMRVALAAGQTTHVDVTPPVTTEERSPPTGDEGHGTPSEIPAPSTGIHPAIFGTLAGATAVMLAVSIGSGIDTLNAASDYRADPTRARYDDGVGRELRTNVLIGVTAGLALAALVTVFFTDWDDIGPGPDEAVALRPIFQASTDGAGLTLEGRF